MPAVIGFLIVALIYVSAKWLESSELLKLHKELVEKTKKNNATLHEACDIHERNSKEALRIITMLQEENKKLVKRQHKRIRMELHEQLEDLVKNNLN